MCAAQNHLEDDLDAHMILRRDGRGRVPATPRLRQHAYGDLAVSPVRVSHCQGQARQGPEIVARLRSTGGASYPLKPHHDHITNCGFGIQ